MPTTQGSPGSTGSSTIAVPPALTNGMILLVQPDLSCRELQVQDDITPRELIGITKFLTLAQSTCILGMSLNISWSSMAKNMGIDRHFVQGKDLSQYKDQTILYLCLHDSP